MFSEGRVIDSVSFQYLYSSGEGNLSPLLDTIIHAKGMHPAMRFIELSALCFSQYQENILPLHLHIGSPQVLIV